MVGFAKMGPMDIWYAHLSEEEIMAALATMVAAQKGKAKKEAEKGEEVPRKITAKHARVQLQARSKLAEHVHGTIGSSPSRDRDPRARVGRLGPVCRRGAARPPQQFRLPIDARTTGAICSTLPGDRRGRKVWSRQRRHAASIVLLQGRDQEEPLFLQVEEAPSWCWRITSRRAGTKDTASVSCRDDDEQAASDITSDRTRAWRRTVGRLAPAPRHEGLAPTWRR